MGRSVLADARILMQLAPWTLDHGERRCFYCDDVLEESPGMRQGHASDCPWLCLPDIVRALEAVEAWIVCVTTPLPKGSGFCENA
jgi:hypothetical protein